MGQQQLYELKSGQLIGLYLILKGRKPFKTLHFYVFLYLQVYRCSWVKRWKKNWLNCFALTHSLHTNVCTQRQIRLLVCSLCSLVLSSKFLLATVKCVNFIVSKIRSHQHYSLLGANEVVKSLVAKCSSVWWWCVHSFIQQIFNELLLCAKHCSRSWKSSSKQRLCNRTDEFDPIHAEKIKFKKMTTTKNAKLLRTQVLESLCFQRFTCNEKC